MKCISCDADIPPQWIYAIQNNICPSCGKIIMDEAAKQLLIELREAMAKMPNDPEGLSGWLLSNYNLQKIGTAEPTKFHKKASKPAQLEKPVPIFQNPAAKYLERMAPASVEQRPTIQQLAQQIQSGNVANANAPIVVNLNDIPDEGQEQVEQLTPEEAADEQEIAAIMMQQLRGKTAKELLHNNAIVIADPGKKPLSYEELKHMITASQGVALPDEIIESNQYLMADRMKRLAQAQSVANGSHKKGGFSR